MSESDDAPVCGGFYQTSDAAAAAAGGTPLVPERQGSADHCVRMNSILHHSFISLVFLFLLSNKAIFVCINEHSIRLFLHMSQMCKEKSNQLTPVVVCGVM